MDHHSRANIQEVASISQEMHGQMADVSICYYLEPKNFAMIVLMETGNFSPTTCMTANTGNF